MKLVLPSIALLLFSATATAQQKNISGTVLNELQQPLAFANVILVNTSNNSTVKGSITDSLGSFIIATQRTGMYKITASATGFTTNSSATFLLDSSTANLSVPAIALLSSIKTIDAVVVTSKKRFIEIQPDKTVLNVENNLAAVGNSAFELIKKAPAVTVDKDDNLKLKNGIATIYVDGKPFYLGGEQLTQYLKNLQADAISKIEIIGNPSSKYDAAGLTGIINIRLKKNKMFGTNGSVAVGTGYGRYPKVNSAVSLNYRNKNINIFSDANLGYSESYNRLTYNSIIENATATTFQDRENYWHPKSTWKSFKIGADYNLGTRTVIGILIKGDGDDTKALTDNETIFSNQNKRPVNSIITVKDDNKKNTSNSFNINLKKEIDSVGSEIIVDADYVTFKRTAENINYNNFLDVNNINYRDPYIFRNGSPADINIKTAKIDVTKIIDSSLKFETGAKYSDVQNNNYLKVDSLTNNAWVKDNNRTNTFLYTERIAAAYINASKTWKKVSVQVGLRVENTSYNGNSVTLQQVRDSSYTNLFPSAFITYRVNDKNVFNASYSRRINRPSYQSLNPFIDFIDPFTQFEGNPNLKPSFTQSFELKHSYRNFLYSTLSYSYAKGQSTNVVLQDKITGAVRNLTANVGNAWYASLNLSAGAEPTKWWTMDNNISFSAGRSGSTYPGYEFNQRFVSADASWSNSFKLDKTVKALLSAFYSSPYKDGITRVKCNYGATVGVQKTLWKARASIKLNYNNFIGPSAYRAKYLSDNLNIYWVNRWEGKRINLSFNYKFGNSNVKASRQRTTASQSENNRVNL